MPRKPIAPDIDSAIAAIDPVWSLAAAHWGRYRERAGQARRGAVLGLLIWDHELGEGEVLLAPEWNHCCGVLKADAASDWAGLLRREVDGDDQ